MQALWVEAQHSRLGVVCWGQIIGVRSTLIPNQRGLRLRGAERFLVLQYEEAPLSLSPL